MKILPQKLSFHSFLTLGPYEKDEGFRELLRSIAGKGMVVAGMLGVASTIIFILGHIFVSGKAVVWTYSGINPQTELMLFDKCLVILFSLAIILLSRTTLSFVWCRRLVFLVVWLICVIIVSDDIISQDMSVSPAYTTIALIIAIGTFPFTGLQTLLLTFVVLISIILEAYLIPAALNISDVQLLKGQIIYFFLLAIPLTGISSLLYLNRYEQYQARRNAEELKEKLEERAHVLEMMKDKSEKQAGKILENEKLKDRFFANISHKFRTPLTLMLGPLDDMLSDKEENDKTQVKTEVLSLMQKNGQQLLQLINQLLDLSKIDADGIHLNLQHTNLGTLIQETVLSFSPMAESKQIDLSCSVKKEPIVARVDPEQLERAIRNLISNALKFTPKNGKVKVTVSQTDTPEESIQIKVVDTGIGIPPDDLPYVFDRFYQANHSSGTFDKGTGIGLALVKEIIELHGGTVHVNSRPGSGSEFIIHLYDVSEISGNIPEIDYREQEWNKAEKFDPGDQGEDGANKVYEDAPTVMLIDDNPDILAYLQPHLAATYNVLLQENSRKAFEIIREKKIDLIISDVMMPEPNGFELCRIVKETPELNHIPVILLTAQAAEESRIEGLELGADDYISKPFSASELMARVENLIELRQILREKFSEQIHLKGKQVEVSSADARFLKRVQSVIEKHMDNSNFGVEWLADEICLSPRQLQRKIRSITSLSAAGYIRLLRLERASQLLEQQWGNVSEVAYRVGFQDTKYFSRLFKQTFGETPSEFAE